MRITEEDIRTKVVYEWLKGCGFSPQQICLEKSFSIQIGKGEKHVKSRSDLLVKSHNGQNLMIVEVKAIDHSLTNEDAKQALSYARLLTNGIAPYTVLTNGQETKIFDSISGEFINGQSIPINHPYITSGFKLTNSTLKERADALEYLLTISQANLIEFCKNQVYQRMRYLKGRDPFSGKKYLPQLSIKREVPRKELHKKLFEENRKLLLVVGPPQHGKTCFMCQTAEEFLENDHPILFYTAIGLKESLLSAIQEDFSWCFSENLSNTQWVKRLNEIGKTLSKKIIILIDGWNEMARNAFDINAECERLSLNYISIILSTTSPSISSLLKDKASNPSYVAEEAGLSEALIEKLSRETLVDTSKLGLVQIGKFDQAEINSAIEKYSDCYNVKISDQRRKSLFNDPFYLRVCCELYSGKTIPNELTKTELISKSLKLKGRRRNIDELQLVHVLSKLGNLFYRNQRPLQVARTIEIFDNEIELKPWLESAILCHYHAKGELVMDFYYSHDLDYSIGVLGRKWQEVLMNSKTWQSEIESAQSSQCGQDALKWFLSCSENLPTLQWLFEKLDKQRLYNHPTWSLLSGCLIQQATNDNGISFNWLENYVEKLILIETKEESKSQNLSDLILSFVLSIDRTKQEEKFIFWLRMLIKYDQQIEELGIAESSLYKVYDEEISYDGFCNDVTIDTDIIISFIYDPDIIIAKRAALFLVHSCPYCFIENFKRLKHNLDELNNDYREILSDSVSYLAGELSEKYYGSMCPGWLENAEQNDSSVAEEYLFMKKHLSPIGYAFPEQIDYFNDILRDLYEIGGESINNGNNEFPNDNLSYDPNQLGMDF